MTESNKTGVTRLEGYPHSVWITQHDLKHTPQFPFLSFSMNLIDFFLNKHVQIEAFGYTITGTLLEYQDSNRDGHIPNVIIVQGKSERHILRGWTAIKVKT